MKNVSGKIKILMVNFGVVLGEMVNIRWMLWKKFQIPHHNSLINFNIQYVNDQNLSIPKHFFCLVFGNWNLFVICFLGFGIFRKHLPEPGSKNKKLVLKILRLRSGQVYPNQNQ
jgi:hypothetical protein